MRTIAILNQKGGSGKTTTAVNLAAALGEQKQRVLVLDLDPAAAASSWFGAQDQTRGLLEVLTEGKNLYDLVKETGFPGIDLIPSSLALSSAEKALTREIGPETLLKRKIAKLPSDRWDYLLLDCPPSLGLLTLNALSAAQEVLIPVEAHVMALSGLVSLLQTVEVVKERLNPDLSVCGILACRVDHRTNHSKDVVDSLSEKFGPLLYKTKIRENVRLAECPSFGKPITAYAPSSSGTEDYHSLAKELLGQEKRN
ncbi:MAG: ParA family protein [Elusimicrobia bacterium]|nr:ParA family protein [Elusimicrobiota bacterium]